MQNMFNFLRQHNLISRQQHGFLSGRSTSTNLLETLNDFTLSLKHKENIVAAYIDYAKAFDSVSHEKHCCKLQAYGLCGNLLAWLRNFLTGRMQRTKVGHSLSSSAPVVSGVIQGSCLGHFGAIVVCLVHQ